MTLAEVNGVRSASWVQLRSRKSSGSGLENREYCRRDPSRRPRGTLYPQKLAETSPTSGGRSIGIVCSRTQATDLLLLLLLLLAEVRQNEGVNAWGCVRKACTPIYR
jgi:hypothetical protein